MCKLSKLSLLFFFFFRFSFSLPLMISAHQMHLAQCAWSITSSVLAAHELKFNLIITDTSSHMFLEFDEGGRHAWYKLFSVFLALHYHHHRFSYFVTDIINSFVKLPSTGLSRYWMKNFIEFNNQCTLLSLFLWHVIQSEINSGFERLQLLARHPPGYGGVQGLHWRQ